MRQEVVFAAAEVHHLVAAAQVLPQPEARENVGGDRKAAAS